MRATGLLTKITRQYSYLELKRKSQQKIAQKIQQALNPTFLSVKNTTLGPNSCGQMFKIVVESPVFSQRSKVEQHKMVTNALAAELNNIHGFNLKTREPKVQLKTVGN